MPIQAPQWTEFLSCPVCRHSFTRNVRPPISLGCGHTICQQCLSTLQRSQCPFDQTPFRTEPENLPINYALLQLVLPTSSSSTSSNNSSNCTSSQYDGQVGSSVPSPSSAAAAAAAAGGATTTSNVAATALDNSLENNNNKLTSNNNNNNGGAKRDGEHHHPGSSASAEIVPLSVRMLASDDYEHYSTAKECIEALALYLKPSPTNNASANLLTRQMQRKVVALICCQLFEEEGRSRAVRAARLLGERAVTELILHHQNPQQLSANLWAAVRARGCQFLGPAMQEEVLKLVLLALEDGSALSRKVLVMFVVQRLEPVYSQASKTSIGHVVQLLYRASCFKVSKREGDSSLMQLKEEFRTYEALRREHDTQIVQIATEAGLRIAPDQWSSLLYGDTTHKSHMQSINDKLQTPESFSQSVQELVLALQRTSDPAHLSNLQPCLKYLADIDPNAEQSVPTWQQVAQACGAVKKVVTGLADFVQHHGSRKLQEITNANPAPKYKVNMCWIYTQRGSCPRGNKCNFAHSEAELNQSKARHNSRQSMPPGVGGQSSSGGPSKDEFFMLDQFGGKKPMGHMQSVETSPMRYPGGGGGGPVGLSKGSPLPPQSSNNLLLPQPYNGDMMMPPMGGVPPPPGPPPQMNHHGPQHHHPNVHHHQGHSPLHVPTGPYSGPPQPPNSLHPYHNSGPGGGGNGGGYNNMLPPTPNQLSPLGRFGFDPTKFNPNIRVSPNLGGQQGPPLPPPQPPVMPQPPGRSPRNFPPQGPLNNKGNGGGGGGFNQNHMFMNEMLGPQPNQMGVHMGNKPNMNDYGGNKGDYLSVQQQQQQQQHFWRKPGQNQQQMPPPSSPQQNMNMNKSPSHLVPGKGHPAHGMGNPMNKPVGYPGGGMQNVPMNDLMSPRQPPKNSPTFFPKDDMPYWAMGQGGGQQSHPQQQQQQHPSHQQQQSNGDSMHREVQRNQMMQGNDAVASHMAHLYGDASSVAAAQMASNTRRMFDRSDSILAGEDAPFEGNAIPLFGAIERKSGDTLKNSLAGLDLRQQAWLNRSQAGSSQTSPRIQQVPIGTEKKLSPSKELGLGVVSSSSHQHLHPNEPLIVTAAGGIDNNNHHHHHHHHHHHGLMVGSGVGNSSSSSGGLWSSLDTSNGANSRFVWSDKPYSVAIGTPPTCRSSSSNNNINNSKLLNLDMMEDDEKDIENGMLEISKKLATELVDDDFAA